MSEPRLITGPGKVYVADTGAEPGDPTWVLVGETEGGLPWASPWSDPLADVRAAMRRMTESAYQPPALVGPRDVMSVASMSFSGPGIERLMCLVLGMAYPVRGGTWMRCGFEQHDGTTSECCCAWRHRHGRGAFAAYRRHWRRRHTLSRAELEARSRAEYGL